MSLLNSMTFCDFLNDLLQFSMTFNLAVRFQILKTIHVFWVFPGILRVRETHYVKLFYFVETFTNISVLTESISGMMFYFNLHFSWRAL